MLILSIDSAGHGCAACVWRDGEVLAVAEETMERGQDRRLLPLIESVLEKADIGYAQLDRVAVARGPGSFTGLRIGLAAARGIGLAAGKPVLGIDRFSIYRAQNFDFNRNLLVVIDAKRAELYCRFFPHDGQPHDAVMLTEIEIQSFLESHPNTLVAGDAKLAEIVRTHEPEVVTQARLAAESSAEDSNLLPRPLYIRAPDVTFKKPTCTFRPLTPADLPTMARLHAASFTHGVWNEEQLRSSLALPTSFALAAIHEGAMVGFIICQTTTDESEVLTLCIAPEKRTQGLGKALLTQAATILKASTGKIFLEVAADNVSARRLYDKTGFTIFGTRPHYYQRVTGPVDAILYQLTFRTA